MKKALICIITLLLFFAPASFPQEKWTLDRCIKYAHENNISLKQKSLDIQLAENDLLQSKMELLPEVGAGASQTFRFGRSVDPLTYEFNNENSKGSSFYGTTRVDIFKGFREINTLKRNRLHLDAILSDYETAKNDLALNITKLFLQILFNEELVTIAEKQRETSGIQLNTTKKLVNAGSLPQGDLLEIEAQLALEELNVVKAANQYKLSLLELAQLLDLEDADMFGISKPGLNDDLLKPLNYSVEEVFESALILLPRIKSAEFMVQYFEKDLAVSKGLQSPSISLRSSWGTGYSDRIIDLQTNNIMPFRNQLDYSSTTSLGINLEIPVFNNYAYRTDIKKSRLALMKSNYQLEMVKSQLKKEIRQAMADAEASLEQYKATELSLASLEEAFRYTEKKYGVGMLTSLDYSISKSKLTKAESDLLQAKYNYLFNIKILEFYSGIPLDLR